MMHHSLAILAIAAMSNAFAQNSYPGSCSIPDKGLFQQEGVCANSFGGFHVICNRTNYWLAEEACALQGWRLAAINDVNTLFAAQTAEMCLDRMSSAWIAAYNGLNQDPCMDMTQSGIITAGLHAEVCQGQVAAIMCQEIPVLSESITTTTTLTTSVGTITRHTTVTHHPHHGCRGNKCDAPPPTPQLKNAEIKRVDDEGEKRAFPPNQADQNKHRQEEEEDEDESEEGTETEESSSSEESDHRHHQHHQHRPMNPPRHHRPIVTPPPLTTTTVVHHIKPTHNHHKEPQCFNCRKDFAVTSKKMPACEAAEACHKMGMKLAEVTISNWESATKAMFEGIGPNEHGWVASWNGDSYKQAECIAMFTGSRAPGGSINIPPFCRAPKQALCQRAPHFQVLMQEEQQQQRPRPPRSVCNTCLGYCPIPNSGLRILRRPTTYEKAAAACAKYGWKLADVTAGMNSFLTDTVRTCFANEGFAALWVRSYEGVTGSRCLSVWTDPLFMNAKFGLSPTGCADSLTYPLCQCEDSIFTGYGPFVGTMTTTTVEQTSTLVTVVPQTTVTVTSTVCGRCRTDPSSCGCSSSSDSSWSSFSDDDSSSSDSSSSDSSSSDHRHRHPQGHNRGHHGRGGYRPEMDF